MKKIAAILFLLCLKMYPSFGQVDTCSINSAIYNFYRVDAATLAIREMQNVFHPWHDSIHVSPAEMNKMLKLLGMVYLNNSPERDTVINIVPIHIYCAVPPGYTLSMNLDTTILWVKQFLIDSIISGNPSFDSLIADNKFRLLNFDPTYNIAYVITDSIYNLTPLISRLRNIPGISYVGHGSCIGSGDNIFYISKPDQDTLIYYHGWGDCPAGCTSGRYWWFSIYPDCSSSFDFSMGNRLIMTEVISQKQNDKIRIYPNPLTSSSTLQLNTQLKDAEVVISDMLGKEMMRKKLSGDRMEIERGSLESGVYFVRVREGERQWVEKVVVE